VGQKNIPVATGEFRFFGHAVADKFAPVMECDRWLATRLERGARR
jgi:hypothetical protein